MADDVKRKLYRDLQPDETLQEGDEIRAIGGVWIPVKQVMYGYCPLSEVMNYRRPVDAVPREEYDKLKQALAEADALLGEAVRGAVQVNEELRHAAAFGDELVATSRMLNFVVDHMQIASAHMDGQHTWRWCHGWPMTHAIGSTPQDAIKAAMAECEKSRLSEEPQ